MTETVTTASLAQKLTGPQNKIRKAYPGATFALSERQLVVTEPSGRTTIYAESGRKV